MGEWSEYFEDYPEENPANYVGVRFDPKGAQILREQQAKQQEKIDRDQANLNSEIAAIVQKHRPATKLKK